MGVFCDIIKERQGMSFLKLNMKLVPTWPQTRTLKTPLQALRGIYDNNNATYYLHETVAESANRMRTFVVYRPVRQTVGICHCALMVSTVVCSVHNLIGLGLLVLHRCTQYT